LPFPPPRLQPPILVAAETLLKKKKWLQEVEMHCLQKESPQLQL
jgi:hypothetical protein